MKNLFSRSRLVPRRHRPQCLTLLIWFIAILCSMQTASALDLNRATEAELDNLAGLGPAVTARLMQARAVRPFSDWGDLMRRVKGVRDATASKMSRQGATIQGEPYAAPVDPLTPSGPGP